MVRSRSESTLDRIDSLLSNSIIRNIVGQTRTTIDFRAIMDKGKILLVSLSARYESLTSLLGAIIIGQLLTAALSRAGTSKRRPFYLYLDEFQRFSTPDMATLLTEARKFSISTTIAHQVRSQLDERNAATALQAGSLVCFRLTSEDAEELSAEFLLTPKEAVKPAQTVPRNVLDYIDRHPNEKIKEFSARYIHKLQEASTIRTENLSEDTMQPLFDFGEGNVTFHAFQAKKALTIIQTMLYVSMTTKKIPNDRELWDIMRFLLRFDGWKTDTEVKEKRSQRFFEPLYEVCQILMQDPILATATQQTDTSSQQTYSDYKNYLANQLVHLKRGQAMVKLPKGEYLMETIKNTTGFKDTPNKAQIIDNTRQKYCRPRSEVEEEIRNRHQVTPPVTTRRGTVE